MERENRGSYSTEYMRNFNTYKPEGADPYPVKKLKVELGKRDFNQVGLFGSYAKGKQSANRKDKTTSKRDSSIKGIGSTWDQFQGFEYDTEFQIKVQGMTSMLDERFDKPISMVDQMISELDRPRNIYESEFQNY